MRVAAPFVVVLLGCGGRVEDGSATTAPLAAGCPAGCDHMQACAGQIDGAECTRSCEREFADARANAAETWGSCIMQLSCDDVQRGLAMDYGPIGECYATAKGAP